MKKYLSYLAFPSTAPKLFARDFTSLALRLILGPVMVVAGFSKLNLSNNDVTGLDKLLADPSVTSWFGNTEWGLGLPFPDLLAFMAGWTEFLGGWLLIVGLLTRLVSLPLIVTMLIAIFTVHLESGWFAITPTNPSTSPALIFSWLNIPGADMSLENSLATKERLDYIKEIIADTGYENYLTEKGSVAILNNGVEFAFTYFVMLLVLFANGAGRFTSLDYWLFDHKANVQKQNVSVID
ncbi:DoxX family protein [Pseudoalteromonas xiamenensis]|uniref:HvfX family Cu-binding RiPP maturation protein n=1 Tax=Pseudoalteromonas xiamenensis TaxID=882626 RepID=UPI0027E485D5|nr:DoxX family protein [Pseudoalteromonas xiamenensis]WMN60089.1 DoxX family protein [Pseudoalteromonas xiamenensis]